MEANSHAADSDMDNDFQNLLVVFGSEFSLEDIASAYCQAKRNINMAGEILCGMHGTSYSTASADKLEAQNGTSLNLSPEGDGKRPPSAKLSSENVLQNAPDGGKSTREFKPKKSSVSMGTVSSVIGKDYAKPRLVTSNLVEAKKPIKLDSKEFPVSEIWNEKALQNVAVRNDTMPRDVEEFLFKMLGGGFQLDMTVIQEVLGICGYDVQKSVDRLLELSTSRLEKSDDVVGLSVEEPPENRSEQKSFSQQEEMQQLNSALRDENVLMARKSTNLLSEENNRNLLQKEVLEALFVVPDRFVDAPKKVQLLRSVRRSRAFGKPVFEPLSDDIGDHKPLVAEPQVCVEEEEDDENSYEALRKAVREYWITMKVYYKAAVNAFTEGDHARAQKFLDQGQFFNEKAREADEKSCQKLFRTSCRSDEVVSINLHGVEPKESLRLLRLHLTSLSSIPSIKHLRVIIGSNGEDTTKGARRRLIMKQLEKESIKWTDEENGQTILIQVDAIDPKSLSFAKKYGVGDNKRGPVSRNVGYHI